MLRRRAAIAAAIVVVMAAGAWAAAGRDREAWAEPSGGTTVAIRGYSFTPTVLTVPAGTRVTWTNFDDAPHTVTGTSGPETLSSPQLTKGQSWSFTFHVPGTYGYYCAVHPTMTASVVVERVPAAAAPVPAGPTAPSPASAAAAPAGAPTPAPGAHVSAPATHPAPAQPSSPQGAGRAVATPSPLASGPARSDPGSTPASRTLLVLMGLVVVVAVAGSLLVGGRTG